jgi:hypothetical protein
MMMFVLLPVLTGWGVSSASGTAPTVSGSGTSGSSGGTTGASGGTGTLPPPTTILFEQPQSSGIAGHFVVPMATHTPPPKGTFALVLWQPNPFQASGGLVPTVWDAGSRTGFTPADVTVAQLGFRNVSGTSTVQSEGDVVGAYINSADLPKSTVDQKMMITPQYIFPAGNQPMPFASARGLLSGALELQVPTASGSDAYVLADFLFLDSNGVRISLGVKLFRNGGSGTSPLIGTGYALGSKTYMLNFPLGLNQSYVTRASGSAAQTTATWSGWRYFEWSISEAQFVSALKDLTAQFPGHVISTDPAQYVLAEVHLNAEFHTQGKPAGLGWSMRGLKVWTTP